MADAWASLPLWDRDPPTAAAARARSSNPASRAAPASNRADRIAEILEELLEERNAGRPRRRLPQVLGTAGLILALITSVLLRHNASAAWTIWPATATICLVIAWTGSTRRS
jgi:hypothetical protein